MTAQRGKDLLLKVDDGTGQFVTIGGMRTQRLALNTNTVDITNMESAGRWRELLNGAGVRRASVAGTGIFKDSSSDARIKQIFFDDALEQWQMIIPSFGLIQGLFQIASLDYRGDQAAEVTFEMSLESAGELTFVTI